MLHDMLSKYLNSIEVYVRKLDKVYVERYEEEIITNTRVNLRIRIRFMTGSLLEINEAVVAKSDSIIHLNYRYHFQDGNNNLVFRYDNAPHFPKFVNFPNHRHGPDDVSDASKPSIEEIIEEAVFTEKKLK
ncbi:MAG: DUF6516 family protein [Thermodesulfobacteriota bacterium]|nr:DUF6516 family protein [Thermodesulfobacteriota bacterium]